MLHLINQKGDERKSGDSDVGEFPYVCHLFPRRLHDQAAINASPKLPLSETISLHMAPARDGEMQASASAPAKTSPRDTA